MTPTCRKAWRWPLAAWIALAWTQPFTAASAAPDALWLLRPAAAAPASAPAARTAAPATEPGLLRSVLAAAWNALSTAARAAAERAPGLLQNALAKVPALVLVLVALPLLPALALVAALARSRRGAGMRTARPEASPTPSAAWPQRAWVAVAGEGLSWHPISGEMLRIGRHPDNDLWLAEESVHRYHAVIQHGEDGAYSITDVSGPSGNGLKLNAAKVNHARLANGDVIELGRARLTFMCAPV